MRRNFPRIKHIYHYLIAISNYPGILELDFIDWVTDRAKLSDENVQKAEITISFRSADVQLEKVDGNNNPDNALCRYEFLEVICRIANEKYVKTKITEKYAEALQLTVDQIIKHDKIGDEWMGFRKKLLYCNPVNDLLDPNIKALTKLYLSYHEPRKKFMDLKDCFELFMKKT